MSEDTIVHEVTIQAGAERVFDALAEPEQRLAWWVRGGRFRATRMESDLRVGGAWIMEFETPHGPATVGGVYVEVDRPRVLAFTWRPSWYPASESLVRIELDEEDGATRVRLTHSGLAGEADRANNRGWPDLLAALRAHAATP